MNIDTDKSINPDTDLIRLELRFSKSQFDHILNAINSAEPDLKIKADNDKKTVSNLIFMLLKQATDLPDRPVLSPNSRGQGRKIGSKNKPKKSKSNLKKGVKKSKSIQLDLLKDNQ